MPGIRGRRSWGRPVVHLVVVGLLLVLSAAGQAATSPQARAAEMSGLSSRLGAAGFTVTEAAKERVALELALPANVDRLVTAARAAQVSNRKPLLSDALTEELAQRPLALRGATRIKPPAFDGTIAMTGNGLAVTIESGQVHTNVSWWSKPLIMAAAVAITIVVYGSCLSVIAPVGVFCTAVASFFGSFIGGVIELVVDGKTGDWKEWLSVLAIAIIAAGGGAVIEKTRIWAETSGPAFFNWLGAKLVAFSHGLGGAFAWLGARMVVAGHTVAGLGKDFAAAMAAAIRLTSQTAKPPPGVRGPTAAARKALAATA